MGKLNNADLKRNGLARLRWGLGAGLFLIFFFANDLLGFEASYVPLFAIALTTALTNIWFYYTGIPSADRTVIFLDILLLTALLYSYGGYNNPFSMVYLVYVTIAAFFLGSAWAWGSLSLSAICFSSLFLWYIPVPALAMHEHHHDGGSSFHLQGMLLAFLLIGSLTAYFITRMSKELDALRNDQASKEKLTALASLTAGAAHELATPLGSVFLIAEGLMAHSGTDTPIKNFQPDIVELQQQLDRAKDVLSRMRARSPNLKGEMRGEISAEKLLHDVVTAFPENEKRRITVTNEAGQATLETLVISLRESLIVLVKNALEVTSEKDSVELIAKHDIAGMHFSVRDYGAPVPLENLKKMGEPFFTTKAAGQGMGLGLYLVKAFAAQVKGDVAFAQQAPGLLVSMSVPL